MRRQGVTNRKERGSCFGERLFCVRKKRGDYDVEGQRTQYFFVDLCT